jgi:glycosyltransferase 2 family protein
LSVSIKNVLKNGLFFLIAGVLIWLALRNISPEAKNAALDSIKKISVLKAIGILMIALLSHVLRAYRWNDLLEPLGHRIQFKNAFFSVMAGYLVNYGIPRAGEITRCTLISNYEKVPFQTALGTVVLERLIDFLLLVVFTLIAVFIQFQQAKALLEKYILSPLNNKLHLLSQSPSNLMIALIALLGLALFIFLIRKKIKQLFKTKLGTILKGFIQGFGSIRKVRNLPKFILVSCGIWICYFLVMYLGMYLFNDVNVTISEMLVTYILGTVGIIITPGGLGAYQLIVQETLMYYNVQEAPAFAFAWVNWLLQFFLVILIGGLSFLLLPLMNKNKPSNV